MRHHTAVHVELDEGSGWRYASTSRRGGHPLGYCADHFHDTEHEARVCFRLWQRAHVEPHGTWSWGNCMARGNFRELPEGANEKCKKPANNGWHINGDGYSLALLCEEHNHWDYAVVALYLDSDEAGDAWQS